MLLPGKRFVCVGAKKNRHLKLISFHISQIRLLLFQDVAITFNKDNLSQYSIDLAEDRQGFNCEIVVIKNITQPVWDKLSIEMKGKKEENYKSIFNYEINVCDFLGVTGRTSSTNMIALWIQNILKYSNLPKSCPVLVVRDF